MSQFLLIQATDPTAMAADLQFTDVKVALPGIAAAVADIFLDRTIPVWEVRPRHGAMDDVADRARESIMAGRSVQDTELGALLSGVMDRGWSLRLFWGVDCRDLPEATTREALWEQLTLQLRSDGSWNWELYLAWNGGAQQHAPLVQPARGRSG